MGPTPTITIYVPGALRTYCAGAAQLSISAHTVRGALEELQRSQSALYRNVCDELVHMYPAVYYTVGPTKNLLPVWNAPLW